VTLGLTALSEGGVGAAPKRRSGRDLRERPERGTRLPHALENAPGRADLPAQAQRASLPLRVSDLCRLTGFSDASPKRPVGLGRLVAPHPGGALAMPCLTPNHTTPFSRGTLDRTVVSPVLEFALYALDSLSPAHAAATCSAQRHRAGALDEQLRNI
jgi:hypothetical protein